MKTIYTDGVKSYDLPMNDPMAWLPSALLKTAQGREFAARVAVVYRARELLSGAVASIPFAIVKSSEGQKADEQKADFDTSADYKNKIGFLPDPFDLLRRWRLSLTMSNAAYGFVEGKKLGMANTELRFLVAETITPITDNLTGALTGFERDLGTLGKKEYPLKENRIVYIWKLDETTELLPSPFTEYLAICNAAGIMNYSDMWTSNYFQRGGVKPTLISIKGVTSETVRNELQSNFTKWIRNVSKEIAKVINGESMTVAQIGDGITDLKNMEVYNQAMISVCSVFGIPVSLFKSDFANYATAQTYYWQFYKDKVIPDCELIQRQLNTRVFEPLGYKFEFRPEQAEPNQAEEVERANAFSTYVSAGIKPGLAAQIVGIDLPQGVDYDQLDADVEEKQAKDDEKEAAQLEMQMQAKEKQAPVKAVEEPPVETAEPKFTPTLDQVRELNRWQIFAFRKLRDNKPLDFPFELRELPEDIGAIIRERLVACKTGEEIKAAFEISITETPAPQFEDYSYLLDGIKAGVEALKSVPAPQQMPSITVYAQPSPAPVVNVSSPEVKYNAPTITVNVPEQPPASVTVNVPPAEVNITNDVQPAPVTVMEAKQKPVKVKRDATGRVTGLEPEK